MKNIMMDIETMGTSSNAVVIQIAACAFDVDTKEITDSVICYPDMDEGIKMGFKKDASTEMWWAQQNQAVLADIMAHKEPVKAAMVKFTNFLSRYDSKTTPIWSHATFDFVLVQNYLKAAYLPHMNYKMAYDIRTLTGMAEIDLNSYNWAKKTHDALDDCRFQINYCVDAMKAIKKAKEYKQHLVRLLSSNMAQREEDEGNISDMLEAVRGSLGFPRKKVDLEDMF